MSTVIIRPRARIDIGGVWDYIAEDSENQADAFVDRLSAKIQLLSRQPEMGRMRDDLMFSLRSFPFERYVIFYCVIPAGIEVVRVLHSARDVDAQFYPGK
jgi:toxin ParE1/3/4